MLSTADFQFTIKKDAKDVLPLAITRNEDYYDPIYSPILEKLMKMAGGSYLLWIIYSSYGKSNSRFKGITMG